MKLSNDLNPLKWYFLLLIALSTLLTYADYTGWRLLSFSNQESWSASGPSGHK